MRLKLTIAVAALLGYAGSILADAPATSSDTVASADAASGAQTPPATVETIKAPAAPGANGANGTAPNHAMGANGNCDPGHGCYGGIEYLVWTIRETPLQKFAASVPFVFTVRDQAILGVVNVVPAGLGELKGEDLTRNGARLVLGYAVSDEMAVELDYFQLERRNFGIGFAGEGRISIAVSNGDGGTQTLNFITDVAGAAVERIDLWGVELDAWKRCMVVGCFSLDWMCGVRYVNLAETAGTVGSVSISPASDNPVNVGLLPATFPLATVVSTSNHAYIGQVGVRGKVDFGSCFLAGWLKGGAGAVDEEAKLLASGTVPGSNSTSRTQMELLGEWNLQAGWHICPCVTATVGYNFLYLKNVVRPGNALSVTGAAISLSTIDLGGSTSFPTRSGERIHDDKFFAHGWTFGLEFCY